MILALLLSFQLQVTQLKGYSHYGPRETANDWVVVHRDENCHAASTLSYLKQSHKSYHYYIDRNGKVYQLVDEKYQAKHAGWSHYKHLIHWNRFSIGVAFQNCNDQNYTDIQYEQGRLLIERLMARYHDLTPERIVRHSDIAFWRGKKDPGKLFDMKRILPLDKP
jgi:N-acetyl-anhydromuramyl-L-alanine amidase AmpD